MHTHMLSTVMYCVRKQTSRCMKLRITSEKKA